MPDDPEPDNTDDDTDTSELAADVLAELDHGTVIGDKVVISRRAAVAVLVGPTTLAAVLGLSAGSATAQSDPAKLGSDQNPIDADLGNYGSESTASGFEITIEGDTYQFNE